MPRAALGRWRPPEDRPDPVDLIEEAHAGRLERLVPLRVGRMVASPYAFLRGGAALMAEDFAGMPRTGIEPVICGDAHLGNFGFYASPERDLVFDLNDFDESHPGPWEWDLWRLTASVWVAGRQNGLAEGTCEDAVVRCVAAYRRQIAGLAGQPLLSRSFERLDIDRMRLEMADWSLRAEIERAAKVARGRTSDRALPKLTREHRGTRRMIDQAPVVTHVSKQETERLIDGLEGYLETLPPHWRRVLRSYVVVDLAHKVVGVGSVGLRAFVTLLQGNGPHDMIFLQLKQARRSCVARFVHGDKALHAHQGQRVVEYQQTLQTVSDPLLGWTTVDGRDYYVRQFRDMKGAITVEGMDGSALMDYGRICGALLAKGHARTTGATVLSGYLGKGDAADRAFAHFARAYADQTEADHRALQQAVKSGRLPAEHGI
ncbi:MAG: DUF2252 domain-containing protein [Candidatus Nephthysia bennettiae]|uniref:DUF2252 domain-containing protein n=2 Tax=Candidatus Nephthysia bennettiae TaxID=3127016 RepID=A0A934N7N3_9BACT|nr:DUF2252 domain-containing protein [Candidatus Dormibacteraeota bacterium]MBJ7614811.1 DUF2252 domain-containing protein [Candidatus Dormibacteraeota bacterium]PZR93110.1 MAG: DUF2252 domain-containing protein [Candidatus Dormibacteraeota bacterium]